MNSYTGQKGCQFLMYGIKILKWSRITWTQPLQSANQLLLFNCTGFFKNVKKHYSALIHEEHYISVVLQLVISMRVCEKHRNVRAFFVVNTSGFEVENASIVATYTISLVGEIGWAKSQHCEGSKFESCWLSYHTHNCICNIFAYAYNTHIYIYTKYVLKYSNSFSYGLIH